MSCRPGAFISFILVVVSFFLFSGCMPNADVNIVNIVTAAPPTAPVLFTATNGTEVGFMYSLAGTSSGISNIFVNTDNGPYTSVPVVNNQWSLVVSNAGLGVHTNSYYGVSSSGKSSPTNIVWITRSAIPYVQIISVSNGAVLHYPNTNVSGIAMIEAPYNITNVRIKINGGAYSNASGTSNWSTGALNVGTNTVTVIAYSDNNHTNLPVTVNFYSDPTIASTNTDTYNPGGGWTLAWSDEFNSNSLDTSVWNMEVRSDGCGNAELEYYTSRLNNIWTSGGSLVIKAIKESYGGRSYTSGRLNTQNKFSWKYGKMVARIKLPYGRSLWPAFWMMGQTNLGWPDNGEIDIMEYRGDMISKTSSALHGPGYSGGSCYSSSYTLSSGNYTNAFHYYEAVWDASGITTYVDGVQVFSKTSASVTGAGKTWVYDRAMYFLMNLGIGGTGTPYTGNQLPDDSVFPVYMFIDWVRIYTN